jgi:hypothetical protein
VQQARAELAAELVADLRHLDALLRETKKKLAAAVRASGTSLTEIFGAGPVIAATVIGDVRDVSRFGSRDRFAACNGTAPIEVSSGNRIIHRLSLRGNRRLNHAIHMAAITQIRYKHSDGRTYYDKKRAQGKTPKEALRALKRQISDATCKCLKTDAAHRRSQRSGPGRATGERLCRQRGRLTPRTPALRPSHSRTCHHPATPRSPAEKDHLTRRKKDRPNHLTQRGIVRRGGRVDAALGACRADLRIMWRPLLVIRVSQLACRAAGHL